MVKLKTNLFQKALSKAMKAVSNNKLLPITSLIGIKTIKEGYLFLMAYDGNNYLETGFPIETFEDKYVAVNANSLYALASRLTSEDVNLEFTQDYLKVSSGGSNYKFEIATEEGKVVVFPTFNAQFVETKEIPLKDLELALTLNKPAAAETSELVSITGAYFGDKIVTTNGYMACITHRKLFNNPLLLTYDTLNLISALNGEKAVVSIGTKIKVTDNNGTMFIGEPMSQVNDYPLAKVLQFLDVDNKGSFVVAKKDVIQALDRLNIFVNDFDKNVIELEVKEGEFVLKSLASSAIETLKLSNKNIPTKFKIDYGYFRSQVASLKDDVMTVRYGNTSSIMLVEKDANHIIALISE
jgi:DNA polymerase III sliding clamp (beta) subunit (PCNA family)